MEPSSGPTLTPSDTPTSPSAEPSPGPDPQPTVAPTSTPGPEPTSVAPAPTGGEGGGGGTEPSEPTEPNEPSTPINVPENTSREAFEAFLAAEAYLGEGWRAETDAPREASSSVSPHGRVQVHLNETLIASIAAGNSGLGGAGAQPHTVGSMTVKVLYDEADTQVGIAALYKYGEMNSEWTAYCYGPGQRCTTTRTDVPATDPVFGDGDFSCVACHGGNVFTKIED